MFFSCLSLVYLWQTYFDTMSKTLIQTIYISPYVAIFGLPDDYTCYSADQLETLAFISLIVRRLLFWIGNLPVPPLAHAGSIKLCHFSKSRKLDIPDKLSRQISQEMATFLDFIKSIRDPYIFLFFYCMHVCVCMCGVHCFLCVKIQRKKGKKACIIFLSSVFNSLYFLFYTVF